MLAVSFRSDGRKGAVFSQWFCGGSRGPEPVEGNAEGASVPRRTVAEKTSPGASESEKRYGNPPDSKQLAFAYIHTLLRDTKNRFISNRSALENSIGTHTFV